jgi:hypothetical protein
MRTVRFGLILSEAEREALARLTEAEGELSQATVVRRLIRREARERGLWLVKDSLHLDREKQRNENES